MIVVAVIAVLAAIAVPSFMGESRKTKGSTEVSAMFAELATKQEQYKLENGVYLAVPACPAVPSAQAQDISACLATAEWTALRVQPPESKLRCSYDVTTGPAGTAPVVPNAGFTLPTAAPASGWWVLHALCDLDGEAAVNSEYLQSSLDLAIQKVNAGR